MNNIPIARRENIVIQDLKDETLIYDLTANKAVCLNQTAAMIWQMCNGKNSVLKISGEMSKQLNNLVGEDFVWLALDQLEKEHLIDGGVTDDYFNKNTRREIIRKVGFASIVTLPLISSLVAPNAAIAQSLLGQNSVCTADPECASGNCVTSVGFGSTCCASGTTGNKPPGAPSQCGSGKLHASSPYML